jgi:hypothetical protein
MNMIIYVCVISTNAQVRKKKLTSAQWLKIYLDQNAEVDVQCKSSTAFLNLLAPQRYAMRFEDEYSTNN